jgi:hypothetical protein
MEQEQIILKMISQEIEKHLNCKVVSIHFAELLSLCVMFKVIFNEDFIYKPSYKYGNPSTICFSEKSMNFTYRVDLFECMKKSSVSN